MALDFPRFFALENGGQYLEYIAEKGEWHRKVRLSSRVVLSEGSFTKFEVVRPLSSLLRDRVHIRSSYNNKFLRRESDRSSWIVAAADEPEEDSSKWSTTLFRLFRVVQLETQSIHLALYLQSADAELTVRLSGSALIATPSDSAAQVPLFQVIDLTTLVLLPKHVSFKGDNDLYLASRYIRTRNRLQFISNSRLDPVAHHESFTESNGNVRLRSITFGRYWRKSNPEWIWCDTTDARDPDTVFRPVRLNNQGEKTIALLNISNNKYCMRWIRGGQPRLIDTLTASASTLVPQAVMTVEEAIRSREIYDIRYRTDEARIYNVGPWRTVPQTANNFSFTETSNATLSYTYTKVTQETFSSSHSWKVSYSARVRVTVIPKLVHGEVNMDATYSGNVNWSEMHEESETITSSVNVPIPPRTRVVVTMVVGRGSIDVPFSYRQHDILLNGQHVTYDMEDGLFTGLNTEIFHYDIREESLPANASPLDEEEVDDHSYDIKHEYRLKESSSQEEDGRPNLPSKL